MFRFLIDNIMGFLSVYTALFGIFLLFVFYKLVYFYGKVKRDTGAVISLFPNYIYCYDYF
jgi:hypothetical protein